MRTSLLLPLALSLSLMPVLGLSRSTYSELPPFEGLEVKDQATKTDYRDFMAIQLAHYGVDTCDSFTSVPKKFHSFELREFISRIPAKNFKLFVQDETKMTRLIFRVMYPHARPGKFPFRTGYDLHKSPGYPDELFDKYQEYPDELPEYTPVIRIADLSFDIHKSESSNKVWIAEVYLKSYELISMVDNSGTILKPKLVDAPVYLPYQNYRCLRR